MSPTRPLTLPKIAARIHTHLKRMEADPAINVKEHGLVRFYHAGCSYAGGAKIGITYRSFQGRGTLTKAEAAIYLAALDAGSTERHYEILHKWRQRLS